MGFIEWGKEWGQELVEYLSDSVSGRCLCLPPPTLLFGPWLTSFSESVLFPFPSTPPCTAYKGRTQKLPASVLTMPHILFPLA